jgi:hypothetical protein
VVKKAQTFKVFIVRTYEVELRGKKYRVLLDGHHNLAAARALGVEPDWRGPSAKFERIRKAMTPSAFEEFLINNLTDSDWYYVDTGGVVAELLAIERGVS